MDLIQRKKKICNSINDLDINEYMEIYEILKKYTNKITENSNGIFINLKDIRLEQIEQIELFISHCQKNKKKNSDYEKTIKKHEQLLYDSKNEKKNYKIVKSTKKNENTFTFQNYINKLNYSNTNKEFNNEEDLNKLTINSTGLLEEYDYENNEDDNNYKNGLEIEKFSTYCNTNTDEIINYDNDSFIDNDNDNDSSLDNQSQDNHKSFNKLKNDEISTSKYEESQELIDDNELENKNQSKCNNEPLDLNKSKIVFRYRQKKKNINDTIIDELSPDL